MAARLTRGIRKRILYKTHSLFDSPAFHFPLTFALKIKLSQPTQALSS